MGGQTVYRNQLRGFAGQRVGFNHDAKTGKNDTGAVRQVDTITVTGAAAVLTMESMVRYKKSDVITSTTGVTPRSDAPTA